MTLGESSRRAAGLAIAGILLSSVAAAQTAAPPTATPGAAAAPAPDAAAAPAPDAAAAEIPDAPAPLPEGEQVGAAPPPDSPPDATPPAVPPAMPPPHPYPATPYGMDRESPEDDAFPVGRRDDRLREFPYYEELGVPDGYSVVEKPRVGLIIPGAIVFGISYGISLSVATGYQFSGTAAWLAVPVVGPFAAAVALDDDCDDFGCDDTDDARTSIALDAVAQLAGGTLLAVGLAFPKKVLMRRFTAEVHAAPIRVGRDGYGVGFLGVF